MGRNPGTVELLAGHRTKAEIEQRNAWEKQLTSDERMVASPAVKADKDAYAHFKRLKKIFGDVDMDDAFYEYGLNRYCLMTVQEHRMIAEREELAAEDADPIDKAVALSKRDAAIAKLRDQLLAWEKENLLTVLAKLRAVPKKLQDDDEGASGVAAFMRRRG